MATRFFTNQGENTLLGKFAAVFANNPQLAFFDVLVAYFRASGYFQLRPHLDGIEQIRILVGIDVDAITKHYQQLGLALPTEGDGEKAVDDYVARLKDDINSARYSKDVEESIVQFVEDVASGKVVLRAHPTRKLHAKIYIFRPEKFDSDTMACEVITGSSNLTEAGLGSAARSTNYEFNVSLRNYEDVKFATDEFERLWAEGVDILPAVVQDVKKETFLRDDAWTAEELYYKLLIEYFGDRIEYDPNSIHDLPKNFKRLKYQLDAVLQGFGILKTHNGFLLSDVVGLGKTMMAILIARQYFFTNNFPAYLSETLVVAPPRLLDLWRAALKKFRFKHADVVSAGNLKSVEDAVGYDLVIVDESHRFRNDTSDAYKYLQGICKAPCRDGTAKKVILLSATPLNNRPLDIRNQVLLFQDGVNNTLGIDLLKFFSEKQQQYKTLVAQPSVQAREELAHLYAQVRAKVIQPLTIRRIRSDLTARPEYAEDLKKQGVRFPRVNPPVKLFYGLGASVNDLYDRTITTLDGKEDGLKYSRYRLIASLKPEHRQGYPRYGVMTEQLTAMMRTLLLKRLDSSFRAFYSTLEKIYDSYAGMVRMIDNDLLYILPGHDITRYFKEGKEDELEALWEKENENNPNAQKLTLADFEKGFEAAIRADYDLLHPLMAGWKAVVEEQKRDPQRDPKLAKFLDVLDSQLLDETKNPEQKLIIFSESKITTDYLAQQLAGNPQYRVLSVSGGVSRKMMKIITDNFDANAEPKQQKDDYNIIITTEVLAEGVNLHRANTVLNYDTPWNSSRLMQRIGRVNRIGTNADEIHIYNFFPTDKVDATINLSQRAQNKLQAFHSALGEDSQIYSTDEQVGTFGLFDTAPTEDESLTEELNYLMEIRAFRQKQLDEFVRIKELPPKIRNAVVRADLHEQTISFLRNEHHNAFYKVDRENRLEEMGFLEVALIFKQAIDADVVPMHDKHHAQVQHTLKHFVEQVQRQRAEASGDHANRTLSPQEQRAVGYLRDTRQNPLTTVDQKETINSAVRAIRAGKFQRLSADINSIKARARRNQLDAAAQLAALMAVIDKLPADGAQAQPASVDAKASTPPQVIITQSYRKK